MFLCRNILKNAFPFQKGRIAGLSSSADFLREKPSKEIEEVLKKCEDKILYSSYLDNLQPNLGYKRTKIMQDKLQRQKHKALVEEQGIQKFPVALKYLDEVTYKSLEEPQPQQESDKKEEDLHKYHIPFSQVQTIWKGSLEDPSSDLDQTIEKSEKTTQWMRDYEFYPEDSDDELSEHSQYGTPDPSVPISKVPCGGCGAHLHCADASLPGYLPSEIYKKCKKDELTTVVCQRCHFLKNYNTAINVTVTPEDYINIISSIKGKKALAILMVDLLDMENSIWPGIRDILGRDRPIIVVGNKVDLLPRDSPGHLDHVKKSVNKAIMDAGFEEDNIKHVGLISATTGFGVENLITKIHNVWGTAGDVYILGCTNVGKSSLFNAFLRSDFCKSEASEIVQRATASPWPGTTIRLLKFPILRPSDHRLYRRMLRLKQERHINMEENQLRQLQANNSKKREYATLIGHIGRTFVPSKDKLLDPFSVQLGSGNTVNAIPIVDENQDLYKKSKWCYDTPGVVQNEQVLNLLTTEELLKVIPRQMIVPRTYLFKKGMSLFLAGLARVDFLEGVSYVRAQIYSSHELPTMITNTEDADEMYEILYGSQILAVPFGSQERLQSFPKLKPAEKDITVEGMDTSVNCADILLSSSGWLGVSVPSGASASFRVWTPDARGIVLRQPSLIPYGIQLRGKKIRHTLKYALSKPFITFRPQKKRK